MCFNKVEGPKTLRRHTLVKKSITQITEDFIKKSENIKEGEKLYETEEAYCFLTVRLNLREPITKKLQADMNILRTLPLIHYWHSQKIFHTKT